MLPDVFKYFIKVDFLYVSRKINYSNLFIAIFITLLLVSVFDLFNIYFAFPLIGIALNLAIFGKKLVFNTDGKTLTTSYFGFFPKTYRFDQLEDFLLVRNLANGFLYNGTSIEMITVINGKREEHNLFGRIWSRKKSEEVVLEMNKILKIE